jgi:hypothetical protein
MDKSTQRDIAEKVFDRLMVQRRDHSGGRNWVGAPAYGFFGSTPPKVKYRTVTSDGTGNLLGERKNGELE